MKDYQVLLIEVSAGPGGFRLRAHADNERSMLTRPLSVEEAQRITTTVAQLVDSLGAPESAEPAPDSVLRLVRS